MASTQVRRPWSEDLAGSARWLSAATLGGLIPGVIVGGLGGRIAMLVLRITSSDALHGLETDDGFTIGVISTETLFLLAFTSVLGILGALFYAAVRLWLPDRRRALLVGIFGGIVGGAFFITTDGIDFSLLRPLPLAIALFIALPAVYGVIMSRSVERRLRRATSTERSRLWVLGLIPLFVVGLIGPLGLALTATVVLTWLVIRAVPSLDHLWRSVPVVWIGRAALLVVTGWSLAALAGDIAEIL